jgi:hypothetical protein
MPWAAISSSPFAAGPKGWMSCSQARNGAGQKRNTANFPRVAFLRMAESVSVSYGIGVSGAGMRNTNDIEQAAARLGRQAR